MIKCINSNIEIYSDDNYNYNNWNLINNKGIFNILNNTSNRVDFCILPSGNIGIGSTAPKSRLDVVGDVSIQGRTTINSNIIVASTLTTAPIAQFGTHANASSNIYLVGGARSRIGIGSASPTVALDVAGATNISGLITANGGLTIPTGRTLNVLGEMNSGTINATNLNVAETISANGGIILPYGYAIIADGGIYTTFINATEIINATQGLIVSAGSLLTANGGISATTLTASGLITANNGLSIPTGKTLVANGSISTTTLEASSNIRVLTTTATAPIVQYGTNASAANNLYFVGGGRARIGIGSSSPTVALDVLGNANISATISATAVTTTAITTTAITTATINASAAISANSIASTTTILAGDLITANGGITVPLGKQVVANGGITATTISASGLITATNGIQANTINTTGAVNTNGGIISGSTITSSGLITANAGISASTITSLGIINAAAGISATTINASSAITGTTLEMSGLIRTAGGLDATTIIASGLLTANNGISASSITSTGTIIASTTTATTPIAQYGTNANAASNIYIVGGGNARVGIGSSSPTVALDVAGDTNISGALLAAAGISTTTIAAAQLITASNGISTTTLDVSNNLIVKSTIATTPITQIGDNASPSSNLYFVGGGRARVGIGSSSPTAALDIVGDTDITGIYKRNNRDVILDTSNYILETSNIIIRRLGDYIPYTWAINSQSFNLNYTLGNVGIGTTEPLKKLHIMHPSGELIRIETNAEGANQVSGIEFGIPSYNTASRSKITSTTYDDGSGAGASDLQFSTASSANNSSLKFIITPTGNIGIGTPTPNNILQIGNAGRLRIANNISDYTIIGTADTDDTTNTKIELSGNTRSGTAAAGNISYVATNTDGYHKFITNSTAERVRITASGNVGIGTTNPSQLLTLYGNNAGLKIRNSADTTAVNKSVAINLDNGNNDEWIIGNSNSSLAFAYNDGLATSNRMIIDGVSGNIGIGTNPATSNYKLNILGNINVAGNLIPDTSNTYNLGSPLNKWKDLYLSGNSIYLDDLVLSKGSNISLNITDLQGNYRDVNLSCINLFSQSNISNSSNSSFTSNRLTIGIDANGNITYTTSNKIFYPVTTPNINNTAILDNVNEIIITTSNFAINTSNKLTNIINTLDNSQSNYVLTTSNLISQRITDLTTDMITENLSADKKFIINNRYDNSLLINGDLTVNSNLIVLGETTRLDTIVYTTERLEVVNANNTTRAFMVQQNTLVRDIFVASNMDTEVFKIANNGDVNISGIYKKDNRDVLLDTSNYIQSTSNNLINYGIMNDANNSNYIASTSNILYTNIAYLDVKLKLLTLKVNLNETNARDFTITTSNNLINKIKENDENSSNYILTSSNNLINKVRENDENSSNYILTSSNNLINKVKENDENSSNYILTSSNNLINKVRENDENSSNYILTSSNNLINKVKENDENSSNYILTSSNNLINKVRENDENASNYILTSSNNLINKVRENDENSSNYILTSSNNLINKVRENDENASNYILTSSNNLINKVKENDENASNYILTASNNLINKVKENDENSSNYILTASNNLINKVKENDENSSNYILTSSNNLINKVRENDENASNYILTASNNLINKVKENDENSSNYILTASNNLINKVKENDENASNYILTASNNLINKVKENDENSSNYILTSSNNLINKVKENDENSSNYILTSSNNLINKVKENDQNSSNYILTSSNNLINKVKENDENASNYILTSSNNLINKVRENDENASNYILTTSNLISQRITDLTTDMITENLSAANKFIVNNIYNNNLEVNGSLTINSNLIVLGDTTQLNTIAYTTERLEVVNANNTTTAFMVQQNTADRDIFVASNMSVAVFRIANNGDVIITGEGSEGVYKRNNRDVIWDTSNYILTSSNNLINKVIENDENASNYILTSSNNLINKVKENDENASNYILTTSNLISQRITDLKTDMITEDVSAANKFIVNNIYNNNLEVNGSLTVASNLIVLGDTTQLNTIAYTTERLEVVNANNTTTAFMVQQNSPDMDIFVASNMTTAVLRIANNGDVFISGEGVYKRNNRDVIWDTSNYVLTASNNLINKVRENDENSSNYILTSSNNLINKIKENDENSSNYILTSSNNLINKVLENDLNSSNYILTSSNNLINKVLENDLNSSNYILTSSNNLINKVRENDENSSNYILTASNNLINKVRENDENSSNYILTSSNNLINKVKENDENASNYILTSSNNLINKIRENDENSSNYILTSSNNLINKVLENDENCSNYILTASNNLINKVKENDENCSNYILTSSNNLINKVLENDLNCSNYILTASNNLINKVKENDENCSNYVMTTSNLISQRITDLRTDMITEDVSASNKFIVNNIYNNNLEVNGNLTINSNLIVLGDTTRLDTVAYTTERLEVVNANITTTAFMVQQKTNDRDIFVASNMNAAVFRIANNGDVLITGNGSTGVYKRNNRDVIWDTSNYVLNASNMLIAKVRENDLNSSNYVLNASNMLIAKVRENDLNSSNYVMSASNNLINKVKENDLNSSNYVMSASNNLINKVKENDENTAGKITLLSNTLLAIDRINDDNASNYVMSASNNLINKMRENDLNSSNYVSSINENLTNQITELNNTQNTFVILASSNLGEGLTEVVLKMSENDRNASNYIRTTSNIIQSRINEITTDKIVEGVKNKFIIEDRYNSNLEINGRLVVNSNLVVNSLATMRNSLDITGNVNFTGELYKNGMLYPNGKTYTGSSSILSQYSPIQTQFTMYKDVVEKTGGGWRFIDNNINVVDDKVQGFCVRIKPNHYTSKILINLNCHIGIDYGTDARWWGLRLYRKIGEAGAWEHITDADGTSGSGGSGDGTTCWLSHNLGAETSSSSYLIANMSGAYYDTPVIVNTEADGAAAAAAANYIYYTVKWCSLLGDNTQDGKLYLNRPAVINALNAPIVSSSWNISEIWQLETSYFPKGGIVTKYTPTQTQFSIYKEVVEKTGGGWNFIDNNTSIIDNNIQGFCVRIMPNHYTSKILINLNCHIGIDYGTDARWWGLRLYRKIGEAGAWEHITDANGNNSGSGSSGTPCWLSHNLGAEASTYSYFIANVSGAYYDTPNVMDTFVYYTAMWCSQLGDMSQNGKLYLNRPATYNTANTANTAVLSSSWNAQEIWQRETTFIPKNAVICQNMSIQTLFNIYRNIVVKTGNGWRFIDNNTSIIGDKIQGFCVRIKPTHPSSKVLVHLSCHIGIDYGTDARWWGLRLYRKIGEAGAWTHITGADGNNLIDNKGTSCWLSHNLGAESSTSSYFVANISGSFFDLPATSTEFVYYTAMWCSQLGDNSLEGKIYLNRPATYNEDNSAVLSSSWNAQEIWQLGTPYEPAEYSIINIFNNNNVGIGTTNPVCKLDVNGTINAVNYSTISDRRYKKDIKDIDSSLELINRLSPVSYLTINQSDGDRRNYGFIAQDLHKVIPEAVNVPANDSNNYTIEYMSLIPLLTKSIQDLTKTVEDLTKTVGRQQKTIEDLTASQARHILLQDTLI